MTSTDTTTASTAPADDAAAEACCSISALQTCCAPEDKGACCGAPAGDPVTAPAAGAPGSCGCR
ncbi:hypothetical protein [Planomonospora parontospora]|uniref:hypothetical protein n=1 Tax=Planomonospora parontospora TaxID=58119 RepID=UPI001670D3C9|nr:hypothetical protein [Planomonospora parontospora]GGL46896.1 hypothetical protein GCM10014719_55270 [Planomonospora parontospora subsp. antibiotica]GII20253.1 hypothetical protein Ppa05_69790 [Planomonospora parontospora subsp. antibiotica]